LMEHMPVHSLGSCMHNQAMQTAGNPADNCVKNGRNGPYFDSQKEW
jgi:hypothetical protein